MSKHSPGPWTIEHIKGLDLGASAEIMAGKVVVAQVWKTDDNITRWSKDEEGKANSRLIAYAPEIYELLKHSFDVIVGKKTKISKQEVLENIVKLIYKIEPETPGRE